MIIKFSDNPDMFVTSAMVAQSNVLRRSTGATVAVQSQDSIRETPCAVFQSKCASSKRVPRWCKTKCGGTKARLFTNLYKNLAHEMQVTYVLQMLRVSKGILQDKFGMSKKDWEDAYNKYHWMQVKNGANFSSDSLQTESDVVSFDSAVQD